MKRYRKLKRVFFAILAAVFLISGSVPAFAQNTYADWQEVAAVMGETLDGAVELYRAGGDGTGKKATAEVNVAYFKFYEKLGFEKTVMAAISGKRGGDVEHQFYLVKKVIRDQGTVEELSEKTDVLKSMLVEDAVFLDGGKKTEGGSGEEAKSPDAGAKPAHSTEPQGNAEAAGWQTLIAVLGLTLREGLEAILVIAAIIAYLVKTDNKKYLGGVYAGALLGVLFSGVLALAFNFVAANIGDAESGIGQEIFEGLTMFLAVIVLFYVSNWMLSKSEAELWSKYIKDQVEHSVSRGSMYALAFSAFLAVSREGAELILFFQGMRSNISNNPHMMWLGLLIAALILVFVYIGITRLSIRLPLKPFFTFTSWLMFVLCISFVGKGVYELQEAGVIGRTQISAMNGFTFDSLGIYDRFETLIPQVVLLVITVITYRYQMQNNKKKRAELEKKQPERKQQM